MGIHSLEQSKILRSSFKRFGRAGISERICQLVEEFNKSKSYFAAIKLAGQLRALALAANADGYWSEKATIGFDNEVCWLEDHQAHIAKDDNGDVQSVVFEQLPPSDR